MLDYVTPPYRDFKLGNYYFIKHTEFLKDKGINALRAFANNDDHRLYLKKMGFSPSARDTNIYTKQL